MEFKEKYLYSPLHKSPANDIARAMDNINKLKLNDVTYLSGMPDFSRAKKVTTSTIYHVNSPGWIFRSTNSDEDSLDSNGMNGIILGNCTHMIDVYSDAEFNTCYKESGELTKMTRFMYSNAVAAEYNKKVSPPSAPSSGYCVIVLPKKFNSDFIQSRRMTYVDYSSDYYGTANCQMVPVLPSNPHDASYKISAMHAVYLHGEMIENDNGGICKNQKTSVSPTQLETETPGMYIMHCCHSKCNDVIVFIPSLCAGSHEPITSVRTAISTCNLHMLSSTINLTWPVRKGCCGYTNTEGSYSTLGIICLDAKNKAWRAIFPKDLKDGTKSRPGSNCHPISAYPLDRPYDSDWKAVFSHGTPKINGSNYPFKVYRFSSDLEEVPYPNKTSNDSDLSSSEYAKFNTLIEQGKLKTFLDLNKTTDLEQLTPASN